MSVMRPSPSAGALLGMPRSRSRRALSRPRQLVEGTESGREAVHMVGAQAQKRREGQRHESNAVGSSSEHSDMLGIEAEQVGWHLASRYGDCMPQTDKLDTDTYKTRTTSTPLYPPQLLHCHTVSHKRPST
jgi:hypothetical protein